MLIIFTVSSLCFSFEIILYSLNAFNTDKISGNNFGDVIVINSFVKIWVASATNEPTVICNAIFGSRFEKIELIFSM